MSFGTSGFGAAPFGSQGAESEAAADQPDGAGVVVDLVDVGVTTYVPPRLVPSNSRGWGMDRFADRVAGSNFLPLTVNVKNGSGGALDLTNATALYTMRRIDGKAPAIDSKGHTNTPGASGKFQYSPTVGEVSEPGEYHVTVVMTILGKRLTDRFGLRITPAY